MAAVTLVRYPRRLRRNGIRHLGVDNGSESCYSLGDNEREGTVYSVVILGKVFYGDYETVKALREIAIRNGYGCSGIRKGE
jgi:hypothetical protein